VADREPRTARNNPDAVLLVAGVLALLLSCSVVLGGTPGFWLEWVLASAAVLVGLVLLIVSMRRG